MTEAIDDVRRPCPNRSKTPQKTTRAKENPTECRLIVGATQVVALRGVTGINLPSHDRMASTSHYPYAYEHFNELARVPPLICRRGAAQIATTLQCVLSFAQDADMGGMLDVELRNRARF